MKYDANGNPDVCGSREMDAKQLEDVEALRLAFNELLALIDDKAMHLPNAEAARMFAVAKTQLELAAMAAIKGVSRR